MMKRILSLIAAFALLVSVFAACGSSAESTSGTASAAAPAEEVAQTPSATGETVTLRCGVKNAHPPFSQTDENGNLVGLEEDVVKAAFDLIDGYEVEFVDFADSPTLFAALEAGNIDFASGQYVKSESRREIYNFPKNYYTLSPMYLASRKDDSYQTLADIAGLTLTFQSTSYEKEIIQAYNAEHPGQEINIVDESSDVTYADKLNQISIGQRDVDLIYQSTYDTVQADLNLDNIQLSDEAVVVEDVYQVFSRSVPQDALDKFDAALGQLLEDGTLGRITEEWTGTDSITKYKDIVIPVE